MYKIGVGPSSSHTLGPWRAAEAFIRALRNRGVLGTLSRIQVDLYGSLALTGGGHGTQLAIVLGLCGADPETIPYEAMMAAIRNTKESRRLRTGDDATIAFDPSENIVSHRAESLPFHPNAMRFTALDSGGEALLTEVMYSIGGGFVVREGDDDSKPSGTGPWPGSGSETEDSPWTGRVILSECETRGCSIAEVARESERARMNDEQIDALLDRIRSVMFDAVYQGCTHDGDLPGGLGVSRRAARLYARTIGELPADVDAFRAALDAPSPPFAATLRIISLFALAVGEENASFGRVVTAPTNGSAGVIPAVLLYYQFYSGEQRTAAELRAFLLTAGLIGATFKAGATISAAAGGCQAEIGVSSAMAAAALAEGLGATPAQALMAAEIAMEHHLGLTCDPIGGLVQIPCIERNTMGAIKAVTSAHLAVGGDADRAKVTLDDVVRTMRETARDMDSRYKETSLGGLALQLPITLADC